MNSDCAEEKGASSITPSARKSIHSYRDSEMGRYGLNQSVDKNNRGNSPSIPEQGVDVVDNVMSKMARQRSPLATNKKKRNRRHSYSKDEENSDDYTHLLSKSLPSTLPSHLYYSDDNEEQNNFRASASKTRYEDSNHSSDFNRSNLSSDHLEHSPYQRKTSVSSSPVIVKRQSKSINFNSFIIIVSLLIGIIAVYYYTKIENIHLDKSTQTVFYDQFLFESAMNNLQKKYNIDGNSILKLKSGISTIFSRMDTGSFMFIYNSKSQNFNPTQFEMFINEVAHTAARYLRNDISSIEHTVVLSRNLDMLEHGELIDRYRDDVDKTGVLLVKEVDSVPSDLAMAFHYYCDEYNPLVKKSAIFFTLDLANCSNVSHKTSIHDFIEKCLSARWNTVPTENMKPLLTRMVDVIIDVTSAF